MKKIIIILFVFVGILGYSQSKYISLDSLKVAFPFKKYTLNTKDIYPFEKEIEIYNFFLENDKILLVSIMPNMEGKSSWEHTPKPISKSEIISTHEVLKDVVEQGKDNVSNAKKKLYFDKVCQNIKGGNYISRVALVEYFHIKNYQNPLVCKANCINIAEKKVSIRQMEKAYDKYISRGNPKKPFPMDVRRGDEIFVDDENYLFKNYLSKIYKIGEDKAYQFWTFDGWWVVDGYNEHRGIDRFVYIPNKGIVGGSYDFYFTFMPPLLQGDGSLPLSDELLWQNILNEKVMIAKELK